ncbi:MAG: hypothetical protein ABIP55_11905 [Tepidisphaeraceae bacterium]
MIERFFILAFLLIATALATGSAAGCHGDRNADAQAKMDRKVADLRRGAKWDEMPVSLPQEPTSVVQGKMPLAHIFDIGGPIVVTDLTTQAHLVRADVPDRTLVRVDERNGIIFGKDQMFPGPLAADHEYGIFALPTTPGVIRQGIGVPGDAPRE